MTGCDVASRDHSKVIKAGSSRIAERRDSPAVDQGSTNPAASRPDDLGLSAQEIERLKSRFLGPASERTRTDDPWLQTTPRNLVTRLLEGQTELLRLSNKGGGRETLLEHLADLAARLLGPADCFIEVIDTGGIAQCQAMAPNTTRAATGGTDSRDRGPGADGSVELAGEDGILTCWSHGILSSEGRPQGTIRVYRRKPGEPEPDDQWVLDAVAEMAQFVIQSSSREAALNSAQMRFASLAESIPGVVYQRRVTPEGDISYPYISESAQDMFGVTAEEIMTNPQALFDCFGPEYRTTFRERLLSASRNLEMWDVEAQIITANGEEKWNHAIARPHMESDGSVLWDGVILDATRIKRAELELRKTKEAAEAANRVQAELLEKLRSANTRFASLAASIPGVVYQRRVTLEGDIGYTYISDGARDLFGATAEEIMANPQALFDRHGPEYRDDFRERLLTASRNLEMWDVEAQIITANGEEKWTHAIARPHLESDGSVLWDGVILDATRIKRAEFELRQAMDAANAANRAKSLFLAQVSHELRTPLNAVIGFAGMLVQQFLGPLGNDKYEEYACDIEKSGRQLLDVINNILEFTKVESGSVSGQKSAVDLRAISDKAIVHSEAISKSKNIRVHNNIGPEICPVMGDEEKLEYILQNLVSNAVKFTNDGGEVRIEGRQNGGRTVVIDVVDTGIGIAAEDIPKVFEPFTQIDCELSRKYEGLGLGMPLAAAMAEMHGGSIKIDSELGQGTKVSLSLPK